MLHGHTGSHLSLIYVSSHTFKTLRLENLLPCLLLVSSPSRNVMLLCTSAYVIYHFSVIFSFLILPPTVTGEGPTSCGEKCWILTCHLNSSTEANNKCRDSLSPFWGTRLMELYASTGNVEAVERVITTYLTRMSLNMR